MTDAVYNGLAQRAARILARRPFGDCRCGVRARAGTGGDRQGRGCGRRAVPRPVPDRRSRRRIARIALRRGDASDATEAVAGAAGNTARSPADR
ncbi:MAG: hypothetical protein MZV49_01940 [Rhodopseudomonas palustris]|nr:hypothetical protein [Rhodopseudomonas palustris]